MSPNKDIILPEYLWLLLVLFPPLITKHINDTAKKSITAKALKAIFIPVPAISQQKVFKKFMMTWNKNIKIKLKALNELNNLFHSLQQRAFRGEL